MRTSACVAAVVLAVVAAGCMAGCMKGKTETVRAWGEAPHEARLLEFIPADTPYVFVNLGGFPPAYVDKIFDAVGPMMDSAFTVIETQPDAMAHLPEPAQRVVRVLLEELRGRFSREGLGELGLDPQMRGALYGIGLLPAMRVQLKDAKLFAAFVDRVQKKAGLTMPEKTFGGQGYWVYQKNELMLVMALVGQDLVFGLTTGETADEYLPLLFGQKKPQKSLAVAKTLGRIVEDYGFEPFGGGYVDLNIVAETLLGDASGTNAAIVKALDLGIPVLSPQCKSEIRQLVATTPRWVIGYESVSDKVAAATMVFELRPDLAADLAKLRAPVPGLGIRSDGMPLAAFGMGIDVAATIGFLETKTAAALASPCQCEYLAGLNRAAASLSDSLVKARQLPMPQSILLGIKGFSVVVDDYSSADGISVKGTAVLAADNPMLILNMAQMAASSQSQLMPLARVKVEPNGEPQKLPPVLPINGDAFVAVKGNAIGISLGFGTAERLAQLLDTAPPANPPLMAGAYDSGRLVKAIGKATEDRSSAGVNPMGGIVKMESLLGLGSFSIEVGERGLVLRSSLSLR
ncbi:MAG: hypothetical protein V2A73_20405 [Pseudomonadota bacterium]